MDRSLRLTIQIIGGLLMIGGVLFLITGDGSALGPIVMILGGAAALTVPSVRR